jgi:tetratricopeptide (TPR) repeat protein
MTSMFGWLQTARQKAVDAFKKGQGALEGNDFDLAISWFNACIGHDATDALGFYGRGFAYLKKADYDRAIADLSEAIRLAPDNAYSYYYRSLCYSGKGRGTLEGADLERALELGAQLADGAEVQPERSEEIVLALRAALHETSLHGLDETVRALAGQACSQLAAQAPSQVPALVAALQQEEPEVRFGAAQTLGDLGPAGRPALGALAQALRDRNQGVRLQAARALWLIDQQVDNTVPVFVESIGAEDEVLCWIAADCLGDIGPRAAAALPALQQALTRNFEIEHARTGLKLALARIQPGERGT